MDRPFLGACDTVDTTPEARRDELTEERRWREQKRQCLQIDDRYGTGQHERIT